jgi:hypothetical protein
MVEEGANMAVQHPAVMKFRVHHSEEALCPQSEANLPTKILSRKSAISG